MNKSILLYLPSLLFLLIMLLPQKELTILPFEGERNYRLEPYVDYIDTTRGSLGTFSDTTDSIIVFDYTLRTVNNNEAIKPISGFTIMFDKLSKGEFLDIHRYEYLDIDVSLKEASSFIIYLKTFEHFTDTTNWMTQRYTECVVQLEPRTTLYSLPFREFSTPNWWKALIGPRFLTLPEEPDYTKVMAIDFQNTPGGPLDVPERMVIRRIAFRKDRRYLVWLSCAGFFLWISAAAIAGYVRRKKAAAGGKEKKPLTPVTLANQSDELVGRLTEYIGSKYQVPELSVEMVSRETGISLPRISALLHRKYERNFKQYLNDLRISESKRLLRETDRTITEIAYAVGYNSIPHFNRVFKQHTGTTPTEYRDEKKNA